MGGINHLKIFAIFMDFRLWLLQSVKRSIVYCEINIA